MSLAGGKMKKRHVVSHGAAEFHERKVDNMLVKELPPLG